jgi:hypothetical protein
MSDSGEGKNWPRLADALAGEYTGIQLVARSTPTEAGLLHVLGVSVIGKGSNVDVSNMEQRHNPVFKALNVPLTLMGSTSRLPR